MKKLFLIMNFMFLSFTVSASEYSQKVKNAMVYLKSQCNEAKLQGRSNVSGLILSAIKCNNERVNLNYKIVDGVKEKYGSTATFFVKSGEDFIRVSTNVMKDAGSRAIGTLLARNAAYAAVKDGKEYYGQVDILGVKYEAGYVPIIDLLGNIIGIFYVGFPVK